MKPEKYRMSFTTGGLFRQESLRIAELYANTNDWNEVYKTVLENNVLQARTTSTTKRNYREISVRLQTLTKNELDLLIDGTAQEQGYLLWLAVCRRYKFIREFAVEVIRERFLTLRYDLNNEDFDAFFNKKAEWHEEVDKITALSRQKMRQVLFKILREADLLTSGKTINAVILTPRFIRTISQTTPEDLLIYPTMESELKGVV